MDWEEDAGLAAIDTSVQTHKLGRAVLPGCSNVSSQHLGLSS